MGLFQKSVLNKYLKGIDEKQVNEAWERFKSHFHNSAIQENIRKSKEEQHQGEFLIDLFVKVLGYTNHPLENYNLIREQKNVKDAKSADGAIIKDGKIIAVIELKGTDTTNLANIEIQAFGYKNNQPDAIYVITSNFEKLRFYIDNAVDFEVFNLFQLTKDEFILLWLCLSKESIFQGIPKQIKDESLAVEETVTKKLYKDYSAFRNDIFTDIVKNNPEHDKLTLFNKTQKLLDRFLFLFFAEDRLLLPPNSIREIVNQWTDLRDHFDEYQPLYSRFIKYFGYLNTGYKGKKHDIFAYNGGLFLSDEILDNIKIDDTLLYKHTLNLSNYDFESEVSVNILGHIFEHSLSEIEEIQAKLEGNVVDKSKTKRKKDGVFYTPKYITKYMVDNTVGTLCRSKKIELGIDEEEYEYEQVRKHSKAKVKSLQANLEQYRDWLLGLTICDPACGSGAFLNQALEFLIAEHRYIDELQAKLFGDNLVFPNIENSILENNLFGVDINDESVEIAKLSLWLRTAQKGRKLTSLNNNIKCGNSLIDDPEVAGELAFNWKEQFPKVFERGGFDVVIGNPPYVSSKGENFDVGVKGFLTRQYNTAAYQIDLYMLFMERGLWLQNANGSTSFIVPNSWLNNLFLEPVRKYLLNHSSIYEIVSMPSGTFESANVDTVITTYTKKHLQNHVRLVRCSNSEFYVTGHSTKEQWLNTKGTVINVYLDEWSEKIITKLEKKSVRLGSFTEIGRGVGVYHKRVGHTKEFIDEDPYQSAVKIDETFVPYLRGKNLSPWLISWDHDSFISYGKWLAEPREPKYFDGPRIVLRQIPAKRLVATYLDNHFITDQSVFIAKFRSSSQISPLAILCILNSELMSYYFRFKYSEFDDLFPKVKLQHFKDFPIARSLEVESTFMENLAKRRLSSTKIHAKAVHGFIQLFQSKFNLEKLSTKLQNWPALTFKSFLAELKKAKVHLSLPHEAEWMAYFKDQQQQVNTLKTEINQIDKQIDQMVYKLYELTPEEIAIIESQS